jgi:hypothetical protein
MLLLTDFDLNLHFYQRKRFGNVMNTRPPISPSFKPMLSSRCTLVSSASSLYYWGLKNLPSGGPKLRNDYTPLLKWAEARTVRRDHIWRY